MSAQRQKRRGDVRPHGQIRQSQIVTTFGPGAMIDLPDYSVIVAGLDHWTGYDTHPIVEDRLGGKVRKLLGSSYAFYAPPADNDDPNAPVTGITAWLFPEWFVAQSERRDEKTWVRSRPLVHRKDLDRGMTYRPDRRERAVKVVPIRFVQACTRGHVSDIDWRVFVHGKGSDCTRNLWLDERGTTGDLTDITVRCECGLFKALSAATKLNDVPLGYCNGPRPWLGGYSQESCARNGQPAQINRLLVRSASNAYFAQTLSAISIPEPGQALRNAIEEIWSEYLQYCESEADVRRERRKDKVRVALENFSDTDVWAEVERRRLGFQPPVIGIRDAEIETLLESPDQIGADVPEGVFFARTVRVPTGEPDLTRVVTKLVKVHRLREVIVQVGFTRFESAVPDINGELALDVERAALSMNQTWLPAVENRGEGVFIGFDRAAIADWRDKPAVQKRASQLKGGFDAWKANRPGGTSAVFPGPEYIMLHTVAHLLITAVALDCGYAASSIRERIYAGNSGYGVMLYTASPDAEGTLGGLVEAADRMDRYLRQAVDMGRLCSNDPVCAQHQPDNRAEDRLLAGAACHGCVLLAESSCERRNDFLDRALVVATVDGDGAAFFDVA
jgi:hypothetical protein